MITRRCIHGAIGLTETCAAWRLVEQQSTERARGLPQQERLEQLEQQQGFPARSRACGMIKTYLASKPAHALGVMTGAALYISPVRLCPR